jgi:phosphohistidine swiveling domain-containing protein/methionine salvage enolase-phosphatase E1
MKYAVLVDEINIVPDVCAIYGDVNTKKIKNTLGKPFSEIICVFKNLQTSKVCYIKKELIESANSILKKILKNPDFGIKIINMIIKDSNNILTRTEKNLKTIDIKKTSNKGLWRIYDEFYNLSMQQFIPGSVPMILDVYRPFFTDYIRDYLKDKVNKNKLNEVFSILITPEGKTAVAEEEIEFLKLCSKIFNTNLRKYLKKKPSITKFKEKNPDEYKLLEQHHSKHYWIPHDFLGPIWKIDFFYEKLLNMAESNSTPNRLLKETEDKDNKIKELKNKYLKKYKIDKKYKKILKIAQGFMYTKPYRKERFTHSFYYIYKIYNEICRRYNYTLDESRWMLYDERKNLLLNNRKPSKSILEKRNKGCVMVSRNGKTKIIYGKEAKNIEEQIETHKIKESKEIKGMCACKGLVKGKVKLIFYPKDMKKMQNGDILVAPATNPDVVPAMKKAGAIVTDQGGITCHAAIVSRELGIPCIIGTKIATKVLKDNDLIEVDAEKGVVRKI